MTMRQLLCLTGIVFVSLSASARPVTEGYQPGVDLEIVEAFAGPSGGASFVEKRFLSPRKAKTNPALASKVELSIRETESDRSLPLFAFEAGEDISIGHSLKTARGWALPFVHRSGSFEIKDYDPGSRTVQRSELRAFENTTGFKRDLQHVFLLTGGYLAVNAEGGGAVVRFGRYQGNAPEVLNLATGHAGDRVLVVDDAIESGERVYLLATVAPPGDADSSQAWVFSFDQTLSKASARASRLDTGMAINMRSEFVSTVHRFPTVRNLSRKSQQSMPTLALFSLGPQPRLIWRRDLDRPEADHEIAIAGICTDSYLVVAGSRGASSRSEIEVTAVSAAGKIATQEGMHMVDNGSVLNVRLAATADRLYSFVNFSKTESVRRPDGWYSWQGYRVDELTTQGVCKR